jgi:hypothetical protein
LIDVAVGALEVLYPPFQVPIILINITDPDPSYSYFKKLTIMTGHLLDFP